MSTPLAAMDAAQRHAAISDNFARVSDAITDWSAPTPVPDWVASDVVSHLVDWFTAFLDTGGVSLTPGPSVDDDAAAAWRHHAAAVQELFDAPDTTFAHPMVGEHPIGEAIDRFYTADVFMHTWDLARSNGVEPDLDGGFATRMREGMAPIEEILRSSGQYGPAVPVAPDADPVSRLMAFVGRDPGWMPAGG